MEHLLPPGGDVLFLTRTLLFSQDKDRLTDHRSAKRRMQTRDQYATPACPKQLAAAFLTAFEVSVAPETIASF